MWRLPQRAIQHLLRRVEAGRNDRWHAELGIGTVMFIAVAELIAYLGTSPGNGWLSLIAFIVLSEGLVSTLALFWINKTGRWRPAVKFVLLYTAAYVVFLNVETGIGFPGVSTSVPILIAGFTFVLGRHWTWPLFGAFAALNVILTVHDIAEGAPADVSIGTCVGLTITLGIASGIFWLVERARENAFYLAEKTAEAERAAESAAAVSASKSAFLATMSHEIRTPMNAVLNMQRLLCDTELSGEQRQMLDAATASSESLLHLLNDILDFSKIEAGQFRLETLTFSPRHLVREVSGLFQGSAKEQGIQLEIKLGDALPLWVSGDANRLRQILINLLSNAVKFTAQGRVTLDVSLSGSTPTELTFTVTDTGIGIPEGALPSLFDAFTQVDNSTTRRFSGTGLGLAITRSLCHAMGGAIEVESVEGRGSQFRVRLTLPETYPPEVSLEMPAPTELRLGKARVVAAEDNPVNQMVLKRVLKKLGISCEIVDNGAEAVARVARGEVDLVLMDMHMPVMDGLEATRSIRALPGPEASVPVIAVTASVLASDRAACFDAGMNDHLSKPISQASLREVLGRWCGGGNPEAPRPTTLHR